MTKYQTDSLFASEQTGQAKDCKHIVRVAFESGVDSEFDYLAPDMLWPIETGQRVEAPFGRKNKTQVGFCVETDVQKENSFAARGTGRRP